MDHVPRLRVVVVVAVFAAVWSGVVSAQTVFPRWRWGGGAWSYQIGPVCTQVAASLTNDPQPNRYEWNGATESSAGHTGHATSCVFDRFLKAGGAPNGTYEFSPTHEHTSDVPAPEQCDANPALGVGEQFTSLVAPSGFGGAGYCNAVSKCLMEVTSSVAVDGSTVYSVRHTNKQCVSAAQPPPEQGDLEAGENCISGSGGEFCLSNQGENCGYFNESFVCLPRIEDDGCQVFGDGGRVCATGAPMPPAPDNGTAGQPATPDEQISVTHSNTTTTYNYFNSTTVSNSSRDPGDSGDSPYDGEDDGNGSGGTDEADEDGSVTGGATCEAEPVCSGDPLQCAMIAQQWRARCPNGATEGEIESLLGPRDTVDQEQHDFTDALGAVVVSGGNGTCPAPPVIELPAGGSVEIVVITYFCELAEMLAPLVMIMAYVGAAFIVAGRM